MQNFTTPDNFNILRTLVETLLPDNTDPVEQRVRRIWKAIENIVRKSQQTVQHTGQAIRVEAVRFEKKQTPYRPLQAYMDADSIAKHVQPWQQILAFIARTQVPQKRKCPVYGMTPQQRKKWRRLWQATLDPVVSQHSVDKEVDTNMDEDTDNNTENSIRQWQISKIEQACLAFCIELLNQTYHAQEYENMLICTIAVVEYGKFGWRDPESYPPILSRVIKVARFMVVQQVLWLDPDILQIIKTWQQPQRCAE